MSLKKSVSCRNTAGFTLIELLVVIAIIAILAAILLFFFFFLIIYFKVVLDYRSAVIWQKQIFIFSART